MRIEWWLPCCLLQSFCSLFNCGIFFLSLIVLVCVILICHILSGCFLMFLWFSITVTANLKHVLLQSCGFIIAFFHNFSGFLMYYPGWELCYETCKVIHLQSQTQNRCPSFIFLNLLIPFQKQIKKLFDHIFYFETNQDLLVDGFRMHQVLIVRILDGIRTFWAQKLYKKYQ